MNKRVKLGKIRSVSFGYGGYQEAMFGLSLGFDCDGGCVGTFIGSWPKSMDRPESAEWSEKDRDKSLLESITILEEMLGKTGKQSVEELIGAPVECTFDGQKLDSWRILDEVL